MSRTILVSGCTVPAATACRDFRALSAERKTRAAIVITVVEAADYIASLPAHAHFHGVSSASPKKTATLSPTRFFGFSKSHRKSKTHPGSSPAKSPGTGGMLKMSTVWISRPASTRNLQVLHRLRREIWYPLHHSRRRLVQAGECAGSRSRNQHGRTRCLRQAEKCRAHSLAGLEFIR